jgi:hypothetical protein
VRQDGGQEFTGDIRVCRATIWMRRAAIKVRMGGSPDPMMIAAGAAGCKQFLTSD